MHARIEKENAEYVLKDLDSSNGTYVNGKLVNRCVLKEGDEIILGSTHLKIFSDEVNLSLQDELNVKIVDQDFPNTLITQSVDSRKTTFLDADGSMLKVDQFNKAVKKLSILYKSGNVINAILDEDHLLGKVLDLIMEAVKADRYVVMFRDEKTGELVPKVIRRGTERAGYFPVAISKNIVDTVMNERVGVICSHAGQDDRFKGSESIYIYGIKSAMCVPIEFKDNIRGLIYCDSLSRMGQFEEEDLKLLNAMAAQVGIALENTRLYQEIQDQERIKHELLIAREIQQILLPRTFPKLEGFDFFFRGLTAEEVGGDYYDWFWVDPERLAIVVADVSGKGIPGALVMAMFRSTLKSRALGASSTAELLKEVNNLLIPDMKQDMFISATLAFLNVKKRTLTFSRAGHLPLLIFRSQGDCWEELSPKGIALGLSILNEEKFIKEEIVKLNKGDLVVFYTDGVDEAQNAKHEFLGKERFIRLLNESLQSVSNQKSQVILQRVLEGINEFAQNEPQSDDITLGLLKVE
jgi:sigma-B regulation protein RsbU (phosphoserine phosphatase)